MAGSQLPEWLFNLLGVYNGPWGPTARPAGISGTDRQGTAGNDDLLFTKLLNGLLVNGGDGNDRITIQGGMLSLLNTTNGGDGSDQIFGNTGINAIFGGNGNDYIVGGGGIDTLSGGFDIDTLSYETATVQRSSAGVTVTLNATGGGTMSAGGTDAGLDVISGGFENVVGSNFNDTLTGNGGNNVLIGLGGDDFLFGLQGDDTLIGGAGADSLTGGAGVDTADYSTSAGPRGDGVTIDLSQGTGSGNDAEGDTLSTIENVTGSAFNDTITGDVGNNVLIGLADNDTLIGGDGDDTLIGGDGVDDMQGGEGDDTIEGGPNLDFPKGGNGSDTASYSMATSGVSAFLLRDNRAGTGDARGDRFVSIENLTGSSYHDTLNGDSGDNVLRGGTGGDFLHGGAGNDTFVYTNVLDAPLADDFSERILDFSRGDIINLSQIDAITGGGDNAFSFIGAAAFSGQAGQLRYAGGMLEGDVNGDNTLDFRIQMSHSPTLTASDFRL